MINNYTDYKFYVITYKGNMPEDDFDRLVIRASYEIKDKIFGRDITGYKNEVQMATCSVADVLNEIEQIEQRKAKLISSNKADRIIASEQVADLSRTFANANNIKDLEDQISNLKIKKEEEIRKYLLSTGLMYRGV